MTIELKVEQGLVVRPTNAQLYVLIQEPLRKRAERLGVDAAELGRRTGLSLTAVRLYAGTARKAAEDGVRISTLAKMLDALNLPVEVDTFNRVLSIGGALLQEGIVNAIPQLRAWRNVDSYRGDDGAAHPIPGRQTPEPPAGPEAVAEPVETDHFHGVPTRSGDHVWDSRSKADGGQRWVHDPVPDPPQPIAATLETFEPTVIEIAAAALDSIAPATLAQYARAGIQVRIVR